jgi:predicted acetyltransferase
MTIRIETQQKDRDRLRQVMLDGEAVSWLWVLDMRMRLLGEPIRMAGIGGVNTKEEHRMKGYARRLLSDTVRYMTDEGFDVSMLFGIPNLYDKFGYAPCLPEHRATIATRDAERAREAARGYSVRPLTEKDIPLVVRLHNEANRGRAGSLIRDAGRFHGFRLGSDWRRQAQASAVEDGDGRAVGYLVWDKSDTDVKAVEAEAGDPRAYAAILAELARLAVEKRCEEAELCLPADHPLMVFARRYGCRCHASYNRMSGGMMRILNQQGLFEKLGPALEGRLQDSALAGRRVRLRLETDLGVTRLLLNPDGKSESRVALKAPQDRLMQLVVGYRPLADLLTEDGVEAGGPAIEVTEALFGGQSPYVLASDRF